VDLVVVMMGELWADDALLYSIFGISLACGRMPNLCVRLGPLGRYWVIPRWERIGVVSWVPDLGLLDGLP